ncbi:UDP-N-acetylglucosamine-peptide N-acetylglucosaminyltransferase [Ampullimonas aquatilis]|uniref:O-linked N-acetylglucosamine transferase, SPINDLY family protein n=1 Tax=Ampullimonas aquatilis TaxID=1341549 RepID=UPI003C77DC97
MKRFQQAQQMCEWDDLPARRAKIMAELMADQAGLVPPFLLLSMQGVSASEQQQAATLWMQKKQVASVAVRAGLAFEPLAHRRPRIRLAYLSNDFHDHATAMLMIELLEAHDHARFEVYAYSYGADDGKQMRGRLRESFEHFTDISSLSAVAAAQRIYADVIDILVDLKGFTQASRTDILLLHPAPVQVNYLGYPGTLGPDLCDYIITDAYLTPSSSTVDYDEAFAYLPHSYQPHGCAAKLSKVPTRAAMGLPATGFVFCCFNQSYKFTPDVFAMWCLLLDQVPGSVLWLLANSLAQGNLRNHAMQYGVAPDRLIFAPDMSQSDHLARLQLADLVLDTAPYNAHTTASDALWVGVPILTCEGATFAARVAGSLLQASGWSELIAADLDDYYEKAYALATQPAQLARIKSQMLAQRATNPLFDVRNYTLDLENLYEQMWQRFVTGQRPAVLSVNRLDLSMEKMREQINPAH